jgi:hypothetical protein
MWPGQQPKATSRRVAVARARRWLGETEGEPWLPDATADRRYRLREGYLFDWHLYRRLRSRGGARGPAGTGDLRQALALVRGAPLAGAYIAYSPTEGWRCNPSCRPGPVDDPGPSDSGCGRGGAPCQHQRRAPGPNRLHPCRMVRPL